MKPKKDIHEIEHSSDKGHTHKNHNNEEQHQRHPEGRQVNKHESEDEAVRIGRFGKRVFPYARRKIK